jgi:hypothetical protein
MGQIYMKLAHNVANQKHGKGGVIYGIKTKKAIIWTVSYNSEIGGKPKGLRESRSSKNMDMWGLPPVIYEEERCFYSHFSTKNFTHQVEYSASLEFSITTCMRTPFFWNETQKNKVLEK